LLTDTFKIKLEKRETGPIPFRDLKDEGSDGHSKLTACPGHIGIPSIPKKYPIVSNYLAENYSGKT
jgi:hypothetical protein